MLVQPAAGLVIEYDRERFAQQKLPTQCRTDCRRIHAIRTDRPQRMSRTRKAMTSSPIRPIVPPPPMRPTMPPLSIHPIIRTMKRLEIRISARTAAARTATTMTIRRSPSSIVSFDAPEAALPGGSTAAFNYQLIVVVGRRPVAGRYQLPALPRSYGRPARRPTRRNHVVALVIDHPLDLNPITAGPFVYDKDLLGPSRSRRP